jgi:hypothetical protein
MITSGRKDLMFILAQSTKPYLPLCDPGENVLVPPLDLARRGQSQSTCVIQGLPHNVEAQSGNYVCSKSPEDGDEDFDEYVYTRLVAARVFIKGALAIYSILLHISSGVSPPNMRDAACFTVAT